MKSASVWPGGSGSYPYIDLLDSYDGNTPSDDEKNQMNVYDEWIIYLPLILR